MQYIKQELERGISAVRNGEQAAAIVHLEDALNCLNQKIEYVEKQREEDHPYSQASYWEDVQTIAKDAFESSDEDTHITESVDGSSWVIYYSNARKVLQYSPNEDLIFDEGLAGTYNSMDALRTAAAYYAMEADVRQCLEENRDEWQDAVED